MITFLAKIACLSLLLALHLSCVGTSSSPRDEKLSIVETDLSMQSIQSQVTTAVNQPSGQQKKGRFVEMWIQPDFIKGWGTQEHLEISEFANQNNWPNVSTKPHRIQLFYGMLAKMFENLPIIERNRFGSSQCIKKSSFNFAQMHKVMDILKKENVQIGVETAGAHFYPWYYERQVKNGVTLPSILENFAAMGISLGAFSARLENHLINCFEQEFGVLATNFTLDNPIMARSFDSSQLKKVGNQFAAVFPSYTLEEVIREVAIYLRDMTFFADGNLTISRPNVIFGITEFGYQVPYPSRNTYFPVNSNFLARYQEKFGVWRDFNLSTTLSLLQQNVNRINAGLGDARRKINLAHFQIDSSYRYERANRFLGGWSQPLANPALPFEKILSTINVVRALNMKVGLYLSFGMDDHEICKNYKKSGRSFFACAPLLQSLKRCSAGELPDFCAPPPITYGDELRDEMRTADGRYYAQMSLGEIARSTGQETLELTKKYLLEFLETRGRVDFFNIASWHPLPDDNGNEFSAPSWLGIAGQLAEIIVPSKHPSYQGPLSNLYRITGKSILRINRGVAGAPDTTCTFNDFNQYKNYLAANRLPAAPTLPFYGNPPLSLQYLGKCSY